MSTRVLYLISFRQSARQRAHFTIWVPYANGKDGTLIHVIGAPMAGYQLEFKRKYDPSATARKHESFQIGQISSHLVHDWTGERSNDSTPRGNLETVASQIPPPRKNENFMAPVNETTNRRCQEWTMDFVRRLVSIQYLDNSAIGIVQSKRDPPTHGIVGLQGGAGAAAPQQHAPQQQASQQQAPQQQSPQQQQPQQQTSSTNWEWDDNYKRYRRWDGGKWVWQ